MLNRIILIGRLTRDPELRYTPNGIPVTSFSLAVERPFVSQSGEKQVDFIDIVVWRKLAETVANHLNKGRLVAVEGRLQVRSYETQEGQKRRVAEVVGDNVRFLDWPKDVQASGKDSDSSGFGGFGSEVSFSDDDIPF